MPKAIVDFDPSGGPIVAEVTCGHAHDGFYALYLRDADSSIVWQVEGDFESASDDRHEIPADRADIDRRRIHASSRVLRIPGENAYAVFLKITQDGQLLGVVTDSGQTDQSTILVDLVAMMRARSG